MLQANEVRRVLRAPMEILVAMALVVRPDCLVLRGIVEPPVLLANLDHVGNRVVLVLLDLMVFLVCAV